MCYQAQLWGPDVKIHMERVVYKVRGIAQRAGRRSRGGIRREEREKISLLKLLSGTCLGCHGPVYTSCDGYC